MVKVKPIEHLISLALFSAYLKGEKPLSLLIMSKVESGKSMLLGKFRNNQGCAWIGDATAWGIAKHLGADIRAGKVRHLLFPEFSIPTSRNYDTVRMLDAYLCGLIEEGVGRIVSFRYGEIKTISPAGCGIIACISKQDFDKKRRAWFRIGLMSRLIPVSFDYTDATRKTIMAYIKGRVYRTETEVKLALPPDLVEITLPMAMADRLERLTEDKRSGTELYGFRWQRHFQRLAMANALMEGRDRVNDHDCEVVEELSKFMTTDCSEKI